MALAAYIGQQNAEDGRDSDLRHLHELVDIDSGIEETPPANFLAPEMAALLHALLRVDRFACTFFQANQMPIVAGSRIALWKTRDERRVRLPRHSEEWEVPFADRPEVSAFYRSLEVAITAAEQAEREAVRRDWADLGLGAGAIQNQLIGFRQILFGVADHSSGRQALTLPDLVWLGGLLWHVLRFDLPYYPTSAELAFQVALEAQAGVGYDRELPSLAQAAQMIADPLTCITRWFAFYATNKTQSRLYNTLAEWLLLTFNQRRTAAAVRRLAPPAPVILTTNYDRAIESALDEKLSSYHVLIPVTHIRWRRGTEPAGMLHEQIWLLKTMHRDNNSRKWVVRWNYGGCSSPRQRGNLEASDPHNTVDLRNLVGPLVIKLHGSPLEDLPEAKIEDLWEKLTHVDDDFQYQHRIVISEADYLRDLRDDLPDQIKGILSEGNRVLVFLGQSIADWNIRMRLADHVRWSTFGDADDRPQAQRRFAINKRARRFDTGIMGRLHINVIKEDLGAVPSRIETFSRQLRDKA
jgi:hypothetical protein